MLSVVKAHGQCPYFECVVINIKTLVDSLDQVLHIDVGSKVGEDEEKKRPFRRCFFVFLGGLSSFFVRSACAL